MPKTALFQYSSNPYSQSVIATYCQPPFGMLIKDRSYISSSYRFGFNGKEKDDEVNGDGNSLEFGARIYDSRLGRWLRIDPVFKAWSSTYQFASNNPINFVDPDGKDEIHFYFKSVLSLNSKGELYYHTTTSIEIIENGSREHSFWVHHTIEGGGDPSSTTNITLKPFHKGSTIANQSSYIASKNSLPMADPIRSLFFGKFPIDDNVYLGRLLKLYPELIDYYGNDIAWKRALSGAQKTSDSYDFGQKILTTEEVVVMVAEGYGLIRGGVSFLTRKALGSAKGIKNVKSANSAIKSSEEIVKSMKSAGEFDVSKTIYRGTTGSESGASTLFLTDDAAVAATYVKNGGKVMKYEVSQFSLKSLEMSGELTLKTGMNGTTGKVCTEYMFTGKNLVKALNSIAKPLN